MATWTGRVKITKAQQSDPDGDARILAGTPGTVQQARADNRDRIVVVADFAVSDDGPKDATSCTVDVDDLEALPS